MDRGDACDGGSAVSWIFTALLSCIAFHYTQADTLPNVTYLVAADKLFLGAYVFTLNAVLRSYVRSDLRPKSYAHITIRIIAAVVCRVR